MISNNYFDREGYVVSDKAIVLERHVITPDKEPPG